VSTFISTVPLSTAWSACLALAHLECRVHTGTVSVMREEERSIHTDTTKHGKRIKTPTHIHTHTHTHTFEFTTHKVKLYAGRWGLGEGDIC